MRRCFQIAIFFLCPVLGISMMYLGQRPEPRVTEINYLCQGLWNQSCGASLNGFNTYKIVLRTDGTATYEGIEQATHSAKYKAAISANDFARLASIIEKHKFFHLSDRYDGKTSDATAAVFGVVRDGKFKSVSISGYGDTMQDCCTAAPEALRLLTLEINCLTARTDWHPDYD